jgi:Bacterial transcriptional regulator
VPVFDKQGAVAGGISLSGPLSRFTQQRFTDDWGYRFEFDVTFDANGLVTDTYSERRDY